MKKIALILLASLLLSGCNQVLAPKSLENQNEDASIVEEPQVVEKTEEEKAEIEKVRKERDEALKIKLAEAERKRLERMEGDVENRDKRLEKVEIEELLIEHALNLVPDEDTTLEEVLELVEEKKEAEKESEKLLEIIKEHGLWHLYDKNLMLELTAEELMAAIPSDKIKQNSKIGYFDDYETQQEAINAQRKAIREAKETTMPYTIKEDIEREILEVTNRYRKQEGLSPLVWSDTLHRYSKNYTLFMFANSYFEHNFVYPSAENLYLNNLVDSETVNAEFIVHQWWTSPGHKKNLLHPEAKTMGATVLVGTTKNPYTGEIMPIIFATQHFYRD